LAPHAAWADAQADLEAGQAALAAGEFDKALPLLEAAAQGLPQSVDARLALAECQLKLGRIDEALTGYQAVLKLSPEHALAKRVVAALTGQQTTAEQQLAAARELMAVEAYESARSVLSELLRRPLEPAQRDAANLLVAEARLWSGDANSALSLATQIVQESANEETKKSAQVLIALALTPPNDAIEPALAKAGELKSPWAERAGVVRLLLALEDESRAQEASAGLAGPLASIPGGAFRKGLLDRVESRLLSIAREQISRGQTAKAIAILWPMAAAKPLAAEDQALKPIDATGGWSRQRVDVAHALMSVGQTEHRAQRHAATLLGYWLAGQVLLQSDELPEAVRDGNLLSLCEALAGLSNTAPERKPGEPLSQADELQRALLLRLIEITADEAVRTKTVALLTGQIDRYKAVVDAETGLKRFFTIDATVDPPAVTLMAPLDTLPIGAAQQQLLAYAASAYHELGTAEFQKAANTLAADANNALNASDAVAIALCARLAKDYPGNSVAEPIAQATFDRYAGIRRWTVVHKAAGIYYAALSGDAGAWALIKLKLHEAEEQDNRQIGANHALPKELSELTVAVLKQIVALVEARPTDENRTQAIQTLDSISARYASLERIDLAEAVIAAAAGAEGSKQLADWGLWARSQLLEGQAARSLAIKSAALGEGKTLALDDLHTAEIALLVQLIGEHPQSPYVGQAVEQVLSIAGTYQSHRSFDVARGVLADFLKARPNLAVGERIEYRSVQIAIAKAQQAFADRADQTTPPAELSAEYAAALDAIAAFLKAHPTGDYSAAAEDNLLGVMRTYGEVGGWSVARTVLERFAAAVPDYREPLRLKLMEAATYLGELDRQYGLSLLSPQTTGSLPGSAGEKYAMTLNEWREFRGRMDDDAKLADGTVASADQPNVSISGRSQPAGDLAPPGAPAFGDQYARDPSGFAYANQPQATALAMIEQSQRRQLQQIAMFEGGLGMGGGGAGFAGGQPQLEGEAQGGQQAAVALPSGPVLSEAEMKRQDDVADKAYAILIALVKSPAHQDADVAAHARAQMLWLFGFFEGQLRADRAIVLIERYLNDNPEDPARVALAYRSINDRIERAVQRRPTERVNLAWLDERHELFEEARAKIAEFITAQAEQKDWVNKARMLRVSSYDRESQLAALVSSTRAGGLLVQSVEALLEVLATSPDHPEAASFPGRLWNVADRLSALGQDDAANYVLGRIPIRFPVDALASQAVLRIKAVESYQEYLYLNGDNETVRSQIFSIAQQLAGRQRYLEALHVYGVFVDSFPTDPRAASALKSIGEVHQSNEVWEDAIASYERVLDEYPGAAEVPVVRLAIAECQINLSQWRTAMRIYEEYVQQYPGDSQAPTAQSRIQVLKNLERYQALLGDEGVTRNKDDAQFQIGRIVREQLGNEVKAVAEFGKVVKDYPKSDLADDAQLEVGRSLLALGRIDQAREALLLVPANYPNSPQADDALYLVGQSYEQQAQKLASVSAATVLAEEFERNQRGAYQAFSKNLAEQQQVQAARRDELKMQGKGAQLDLEEAAGAFRYNAANFDAIANTTRQAEIKAETETALQVANRQDRINEALRDAVAAYSRATGEYPLGDMTDESLLRIAQIFETELKDRDAAMKTYQRVVELFPGTPVAEDAAWKLASFYEQEGKFTLAADAYGEFIRKYPASSRVADAQFALAEVYEQLGKWVEAMDAYEVFRQKFGQHPKAQLASEQIIWIKAYRK
jgi:TolA-binding protein